MANREELLIIRAARAGQATAQLTLGKRYLFGSSGLPKNLPSALYWLDRAAQQDEPDAWLLIGSHVPFETARQATQPAKLCVWYERAFEAGVAQAGLVLAKLVLGQADGAVSESMRTKATRALHAAASAGIADAQWLLAQIIGQQHPEGMTAWPAEAPEQDVDHRSMLEWATRAANSGVTDARYALAEHAWASSDRAAFKAWALPLARRLVDEHPSPAPVQRDIDLAVRCARLLCEECDYESVDIARLLEFASLAGNRDAQLLLGLWLAHMDAGGHRVDAIPGAANYKKAMRWLAQAAEQGLPDAWYALSRLYLKPECSRRSVADAQHCLKMAAQCGHGLALMEMGVAAWRMRREHEDADVEAVGWLQKAAAKNVTQALPILEKIASIPTPAAWASEALKRMNRDAAVSHPLLHARLEIAACFGLNRAEALLIDPKAADRGHCLLVDVRAMHPHSRRRLIAIRTAAERQLLDRLIGLFERVDCGAGGPEGNYRQRLYRLKTLTSE